MGWGCLCLCCPDSHLSIEMGVDEQDLPAAGLYSHMGFKAVA